MTFVHHIKNSYSKDYKQKDPKTCSGQDQISVTTFPGIVFHNSVSTIVSRNNSIELCEVHEYYAIYACKKVKSNKSESFLYYIENGSVPEGVMAKSYYLLPFFESKAYFGIYNI